MCMVHYIDQTVMPGSPLDVCKGSRGSGESVARNEVSGPRSV